MKDPESNDCFWLLKEELNRSAWISQIFPSLTFMPQGSHFCHSFTAHDRTVEGVLGAVGNILSGAVGRGPGHAGEGHADLYLEQLQEFPLVALASKEVDKGVQAGIEVHQNYGDVQRHLKGREVSAAGVGHELADHELQDVDVIGAVADDEH